MTNSTRHTLLGAILALAVHGSALADTPEEKEKLAECAKQMCSMVASKNAHGPDLTCDLTKSWAKEDLEKGADYKHISWGFGSARCNAKVTVKRADIIAALTSHEYKLKISKQAIACEIGEEKYTIRATLAPELTLKDGAVTHGELHMDNIEGTALIKGVVWSAAALERHFGLFENDVVRESNKFLQKECPKILATQPPPKPAKHK